MAEIKQKIDPVILRFKKIPPLIVQVNYTKDIGYNG